MPLILADLSSWKSTIIKLRIYQIHQIQAQHLNFVLAQRPNVFELGCFFFNLTLQLSDLERIVNRP